MTQLIDKKIKKRMAVLNSTCAHPLATVIDIETCSLETNAKILSIGLVTVNLVTLSIVSEFFVNIDPNCAHNVERCVDDSTMEWWHGEGMDGAREIAFSGDIPLIDALKKVSSYLKMTYQDLEPELVGNGSEFDNVIVKDAYIQCGLKTPWKFRSNQSLRSVVWLGRVILGVDPKLELEFEGIEHHALDDARHESKYLLSVFKSFFDLVD